MIVLRWFGSLSRDTQDHGASLALVGLGALVNNLALSFDKLPSGLSLDKKKPGKAWPFCSLRFFA
jgi:hypothetical protein